MAQFSGRNFGSSQLHQAPDEFIEIHDEALYSYSSMYYSAIWYFHAAYIGCWLHLVSDMLLHTGI